MRHPDGPEEYAWMIAAACVAIAYVASTIAVAFNKFVE